LEKVQREIAGINHNLKVKVVPIDLANTTDYSAITADKEVSDNLGLVVNNAGQLLEGKFFGIAPERL
jgi:short-subunit dehydrogenase